jgi:DNA-binding SARP family transcriptional activator
MLLARLALQPQRRHSREELIELLWPGVDADVGRNRLRQVLSTLRRLLEPLVGNACDFYLARGRTGSEARPIDRRCRSLDRVRRTRC